MLRRVFLVLLALCGVSTAAAQRPTVLKIDPDLKQNLRTLAAGLHNEVILCLYGRVGGDTTYLDDMEMRRHELSTTLRSAARACPDSTLGWWHNHSLYRWRETDNGNVLRHVYAPTTSCRLSATDVATSLKSEIPWVLLSTDKDHLCWWHVTQLDVTPLPLVPPPGQTSWKGKR